MWLNINKLYNYNNFISKIGIRKDYNRRTGEWSYWNWIVYDKYKKYYRIIEGSIGKKWDDVFSKLLSETPEKHKYLITEKRFKPNFGYLKNGIYYTCYDYGDEKSFMNEILIDEPGILIRSTNGYDQRKFFKNSAKITTDYYYNRKLLAWANSCNYAFLDGLCDSGRKNVYYGGKYHWKDEEGIYLSGSFENMIAWFEHHFKSYLIYHKGLLFYSENFNKTMIK